MKNIVKMMMVLAALLVLGVGQVWASPIGDYSAYVQDNYIGSKAYSYGDVIGASEYFDISAMSVSNESSLFSFDIYTSFAGRSGALFQNYTVGNAGVLYGDLLLANNWNPHGSSPYTLDDASNGTKWTYGLVLDGRSGTSGSVFLYSLDGDTNVQNVLLSDDLMTGSAYWRDGQEVVVDTQSGSVSNLGSVGSWLIDDGIVRILADLSGSSLLNGQDVAFHWTMTCGNDVIEGSISPVPVPEPGTLLLLGSGLAGLALYRRRTRK